ncbi:TPA: hypothetical protein ENS27_15625 [bacterium]|nr:hypothetical protein [bacterium]
MKIKIKAEPVNIKISDNLRYCLVAWLMDRGDFLDDLQKTRRLLGIDKKLVGYEAVKEWFKTELEDEQQKTPIKKVFDPLSGGGSRFIFPKTESEKLTIKLLEKYHKPPLYFEAIRYAIVSGVVTDKEFTKTAFCQILPPDYQMIDMEHDITNFVDHDQPVMVIVISPETQLKEVVKVFREEVPHLRTEYVAGYLKSKQLTPDQISNIRRDRRWYWMHEQGMSYKTIFNKEGKETLDDVDGVIKAIKRYQKKLTAEI